MKVAAITGSRDLRPDLLACVEAVRLARRHKAVEVWHGDCRGTDRGVALTLERHTSMPTRAFPAPWGLLGSSAGPTRNANMLDGWQWDGTMWVPVDGTVVVLIAFPGNRGTRDCMRAAKKRDIPVETIGW